LRRRIPNHRHGLPARFHGPAIRRPALYRVRDPRLRIRRRRRLDRFGRRRLALRRGGHGAPVGRLTHRRHPGPGRPGRVGLLVCEYAYEHEYEYEYEYGPNPPPPPP